MNSNAGFPLNGQTKTKYKVKSNKTKLQLFTKLLQTLPVFKLLKTGNVISISFAFIFQILENKHHINSTVRLGKTDMRIFQTFYQIQVWKCIWKITYSFKQP